MRCPGPATRGETTYAPDLLPSLRRGMIVLADRNYQVVRIAMTDAASTRPGTDSDRASCTIAWQPARDQLTCAANVLAGTVIDLAGVIGQHVLAALLPGRRLRVSPGRKKLASHNACLSILCSIDCGYVMVSIERG